MFEVGRCGVAPMVLAQKVGSGRIVEGRNDIVRDFLASDSEWLWFVDADMGFAPDTLAGLLASADPNERPIVGALCFGLKKGAPADWDLQADFYRMFPTVYVWQERDDEVGFQVVADYPRDRLVQVSATGAACVLAHRSVLEKIRDRYGECWFDLVRHPKGNCGRGTEFGEDLSFFVRVAGVDVPVFVNTAIKTSHDKGGIFLTETTWDDQQRLNVLRPEPAA